MKAVCWRGSKEVRTEEVPDPRILNPRDAVVRVTSTAICGSDLHLYNGVFKGMQKGDVLGHEFMGVVEQVGSGVKNLREGDRVVVPFHVSCGGCFFCRMSEYSCCDNSNPNAVESEDILGAPVTGMFGYSHLTGGYAGGQAEMVRVPFADVGPLKLPDAVPDEKVLFLSDILPTAWMGAENCGINPGDTVAVWGCGPVGLLAIHCLQHMGAGMIIAIDSVRERLAKAKELDAIPLDFEDSEIYECIYDLTGGRGPDACLDAVGMEAHGTGVLAAVDRVKQTLKIENDRPAVLRQMIRCCRKAGTISLLGVYSGMIDTFPMGVAFNKGLKFRMGQTPVHRYQRLLLEKILDGDLNPELVISHTLPLDRAEEAYQMFADRADGCTKVVLKPAGASAGRANGKR
jgi:threonine dehydrogenase-like Zn-dependent dehydrogenase